MSGSRALGVRVAIDDFGSGYSSLAYLHQLPIDELKIDRSLLSTGTAPSGSSDALIRTIVQIGRALGIRTLAEGIEDPAQLHRLQLSGCDRGQGFLLSRPVEAGAVEAWISPARYRPASSTAGRRDAAAGGRVKRSMPAGERPSRMPVTSAR